MGICLLRLFRVATKFYTRSFHDADADARERVVVWLFRSVSVII